MTIEDELRLQSATAGEPDPRTDQVRGRLDAVLVAARVAPLTRHVGLMPTITVTHTEPFHISKAVATLDYASNGRAGVRVKVSAARHEAAHFGRRLPGGPAGDLGPDLLDEAADYVEVIRRLWDSWDDDAEIRDVPAGKFIDAAKLHYIDFSGRWFSVRGPSITPRPPQGQPVVGALGHGAAARRLIAQSADLGFVTPRTAREAAAAVAEIRDAQRAVGREAEPVHIFGDLVVFLGPGPAAAASRRDRLDELAGAACNSDAAVFTGTAVQLADLLLEWQQAGLTGFRLRPGVIPDDLEAITRDLVPELQRRGAFRRAYEEATLRGLLGLVRPRSRYAGT